MSQHKTHEARSPLYNSKGIDFTESYLRALSMKTKKGFFTGFRRAGTSSESARERPLGIDMVDFVWSLSEDDFISETDGIWSSGSSSQEDPYSLNKLMKWFSQEFLWNEKSCDRRILPTCLPTCMHACKQMRTRTNPASQMEQPLVARLIVMVVLVMIVLMLTVVHLHVDTDTCWQCDHGGSA